MIHSIERELNVWNRSWICHRGDGTVYHGRAVQIARAINDTLLLAHNVQVTIIDENAQLPVRLVGFVPP